MKSKVAIYARLSREDEDKIDGNKSESRSIENQIKDVFIDVHFQNGHPKVGLKGGWKQNDACLMYEEVFFNGFEGWR